MPMIAPSIGAAMLRFASWRGIFATQAVLATAALLVSWRLYRETATERVSGHFFALMARYGRLAANTRYVLAVTVMGLIVGPFFGFIGLASFVYTKIYGLSNEAFGLLFGLNALMGMSGAFASTRITKWMSDTALLTICLIGGLVGGAVVLLCGGWHYATFAAGMCLVTFFCGMSRPLSNHLILEQVRTDIGSASSFIVFYHFMVGAICMKIVTAPWHSPIRAFGVLAVLVPVTVLAIWPLLLRLLRMPRAGAGPSGMAGRTLSSDSEEDHPQVLRT
jgi:DHA1 family bicyclomycin/chloramphenicol resistance-like MFS transporter